MGKLAAYVLQMGFGVKNPDEFINAAPQQQGMPAGPAGVAGAPPASPEVEAMLAAQQTAAQQQPPLPA
jgi:hypothetical protein